MGKKTKKDDVEITYDTSDWTLGSGGQWTGSATLDGIVDPYQMSFSFDDDNDLRKKYPALQDCYDHYVNIKQMCEAREKEENAD